MEKVKSTTQLEFGTEVHFDSYMYRIMDSTHMGWYPIQPRRDRYKYVVPSDMEWNDYTLPESKKDGRVEWREHPFHNGRGILIGYARKYRGKANQAYYGGLFEDGEAGYFDHFGLKSLTFAEVACKGSGVAVLFLVPPTNMFPI